MLRIDAEHPADTTILHCSGRIVAGAESNCLLEAVVGEADKRSVMIDLAGVDIIDAAGLGLFAFLQSLGYALGFELQLANPTSRIRELLELTKLDSVLDISRSDGVGGRGLSVAPPNYPFFPLLDGWSTRS